MRRSLALAFLPVLLSTPVFAKPSAPPAPAAVEHSQQDPQVASLRRTLASVLLLEKLKLTPDQKKELAAIATDARALREKARAAAPASDTRKQLLEKAIQEARDTGRVSDATRESVRGMREGAKARAESSAPERKALRARLEKIITPGKRAELRDSQQRSRRDGKRRGAGLLRLLMSDEFAAELAK